jgi:superfamily II DNA or RNA helicase
MKEPDLIVIDESHHSIKKSTFGRVLAAFPRAFRIGVTATPQRLSGEPLSDIFDDLIIGPSVAELTELGALSPYKIFAPSTISTESIHMRGGDYAKKEIAEAADKPTITGDAVNHYNRLARGKRAVAFCCSVEHAKHVAAQFNSSGIPSCSIDGSLAGNVRHGIIEDFKHGKIQVLTSCDIISEGFDCPAIEVAIMLRPTASLALHIQQSGRALRPYEGKTHAIILDHAGNVFRHGLPDDPRDWTLQGRDNAKKKSGSEMSIRTCAKCFAALRGEVLVCSFCGYVFPIQPREITQAEGELEEIDLERIRSERKASQGQAKTLDQLIALGYARGYKNPHAWASYIIKAREKNRHDRQRTQ